MCENGHNGGVYCVTVSLINCHSRSEGFTYQQENYLLLNTLKAVYRDLFKLVGTFFFSFKKGNPSDCKNLKEIK